MKPKPSMQKPLLSEEFSDKFQLEFHKRYAGHLRHGERLRIANHAIEEGAWTLSVIFENPDRSLHLPVDVALVGSDNPKLSHDEARDVLVDFIDYFFDRYFRDAREVTLPLDWAGFPFGDYTVRARGWEKNLRLEELADKLLEGEPIDHLVKKRGERLTHH